MSFKSFKVYTSSKRLVSTVSSILRPTNKYGKAVGGQSHSHLLMMNEGLMYPAIPGSFHLLPLSVLSLEKLIQTVDIHMKSINGQKILMPTLSTKKLWEKSGRLNTMGEELLTLKDRTGHELCLGPTHEETVTHLFATMNKLSYKQLPAKVYQITTKFRDELRAKMGLLRAREFIMKDMYAFDADQEASKVTYNQVCDAYEKLFKNLGVEVKCVKGSSGAMGGSVSQEFHIVNQYGEDSIRLCSRCNYGENSELSDGDTNNICPNCGGDFVNEKGIEVGHAFMLGDHYSKSLDAKFINCLGKPENFHMSCYGLGITRMLAAFIEVLSTAEEIRWPIKIAPFLVAIIPPKQGSKEESAAEFSDHFAKIISQNSIYTDNVLVDDRLDLTIGRRVKELKAIGIPYLLVIGKKACEDIPKFEVINVYKDESLELTHAETMEYFGDAVNEL